MSDQIRRVLVAAILIPVALVLVWYGGLLLALLVSVVALLGTREFFDLAERTGEGARPIRWLGLALAGLAPLVTWVLAGPKGPLGGPLEFLGMFVAGILAPLWLWLPWPLALLLVPLGVLTAVLFARPPGERPLGAAAATLLGPVYAGLLPCALLVIRFDGGPERSWSAAGLVFFPLVITWVCDSAAMYGGRLFGRTKLWPQVSPGKTRAGAVAGLIGGVAAAVAYVPLVFTPAGRTLPLWEAGILGFGIAAIAQIGDLAESLLKREAGVKDSSGLIPGHGGVLDRFDSLYFVLPVAAVMYRVLGVT